MRKTALQKKADYAARMKPRTWESLNVAGIEPYRIVRVTGVCDPIRGYSHGPLWVEVVAFEVVDEAGGFVQRFTRLKDAKQWAICLAGQLQKKKVKA
jgi:hypothetical protein